VSITRISGLSPEAQVVESRTIELVGEGLDRLIEQYRKRFGVVVATDLARELFPDYTASLKSRLRFALAVQRSAAHVADAVYERILSAPVIGDALFTAGGTGAFALAWAAPARWVRRREHFDSSSKIGLRQVAAFRWTGWQHFIAASI
jgi:hypothetical protein